MKKYYQQMRDSQTISLSRATVRDMLYVFARTLMPDWDEDELYKSVDEFLDEMEL